MEIERIKEWQKENPLHKWREARGIALSMVASAIGVSTNTAAKWEAGTSTPNDENMYGLAVLMGMPVADLIDVWAEWLERRGK